MGGASQTPLAVFNCAICLVMGFAPVVGGDTCAYVPKALVGQLLFSFLFASFLVKIAFNLNLEVSDGNGGVLALDGLAGVEA